MENGRMKMGRAQFCRTAERLYGAGEVAENLDTREMARGLLLLHLKSGGFRCLLRCRR